MAAYRRDLSRYDQFCTLRGVTNVQDITPNLVADFSASLASHFSSSSAARIVVSVRGFHRFALAEGWTSENPSTEVHPVAIPLRLPKAMEYHDVVAVLDATEFSELPHRDRAVLEVLYGCGVRVSELVGLDLDDIDYESRTVIVTGKGNKQRLIPIGEFALIAIKNYLTGERSGLLAKAKKPSHRVFLNTRGAPLSRQSAWEIVSRAAQNAGIEGVTPHSFRHSYATHLLQGGADVRTVQELLGHSSVTTTQIYTLVTVDSLREIYAETHPRAR